LPRNFVLLFFLTSLSHASSFGHAARFGLLVIFICIPECIQHIRQRAVTILFAAMKCIVTRYYQPL